MERNRHLVVVPDFFDRAEEMRAAFEARVGSVRRTSRERFVWDYWHVPGQYTYVRTPAQLAFRSELLSALAKRLRSWGRDRLGCTSISDPWLSFYVAGCRQELHTDVPQGPWAYVFSLTRWDERRFTGGETVLLSPDPSRWAAPETGEARELDAFMDRVPPRFNQLTVFDPRLPHGVAMVEGTWDPLESRVVIHGWFTEPRLRVEGAVDLEAARRALDAARPALRRGLDAIAPVNGLVVMRVSVGTSGEREVAVVSENLVSSAFDRAGAEQAVEQIIAFLAGLELPLADGPSTLLIPVRLPLR